MKKQPILEFIKHLFPKKSFGITTFAILIFFSAQSSFAQQWGILGNDTEISPSTTNVSTYPYIAVVGDVPYVVYTEGSGSTGIAKVKKRNTDGTWSQVGSDLSATAVSFTRIYRDGNGKLYVGYLDNANGTKLAVKTFDGNDWIAVETSPANNIYVSSATADVGSTPAGSSTIRYEMTFDSNNVPYITYSEATHPVVKKLFNGTWTAVGTLSATDISTGNGIALDSNNVPYIVYINTAGANNGPIKVLRFDGSNWADVSPISPVGTAPTTNVRHTCIAIDSENKAVVSYRTSNALFTVSLIRCTINSESPLAWTWDFLQTLPSSAGTSDVTRNTLIRDTDGNLYSAFYTKKNTNAFNSKVQVYKRTGNGTFSELINTQVAQGADFVTSSNTLIQNAIVNLGIAIGSNTAKPYIVYSKFIANSTTNYSATVRVFEPLTTWDGTTWSNGDPDAGKSVSILANYTPIASMVAGNLTIDANAAVVINSPFNLTVAGNIAVKTGSSLTIANNANLIQTRNSAVNTGSIVVNRNSNALSRLDYTMWSSPVVGQNLATFSPLTSQSPSRFYTYDSATNLYSTVASPTTTNFVAGTGYLIRMPNTAVTAPDTETFAGQFTGVPNNGPIGFTGLTSDAFYAVGNPYPSTISANSFLTANNANGTLYFWRKTNGTGSAYAVYNTLGGTAASTTSEIPNGTIQVGQGFIVKTGAAATTLNFTNAMRTANNDNQIFRTKAVQKNRVWLNLTNTTGVFSQALVGYIDGATQGVDEGIDGAYINDSPVALTSNINGQEYTIQGRPAFDASDVVALNFKTDVAGDYTIAIDHTDGLFAAGQDVYLVDSATGTETNLKTDAYTFTATTGTAASRFSLKYQKTLGVDAPAFNENNVAVYKNNGTLYVNSGANAISNIKVFDIQGRLIAEQKNVNTTSTSIKNLKANQQVLIVKVTSQDNKVVNKKVVN